ncbi:TPA: hypothetical protein ACG5DM_004207 [Pseudomonas putida]|jgi:hypothetical protein|uniref:Uncharacterized protein n=2 Tax=Pseudomonas TaxID=286 RepID=A0AAJ5V3R8_9PSED|nr:MULTISPECIES: hypothetical protein [Pseudomonas]MCT8164141.1 hypothetical protein [Pseudomonas sp. HD6422]MCT8182871.1 hypothetical protein [Pseudomonas sp. HD6421]MDH1932640.1 hypothetical protein [Pseudomonas sp. GD03696]MDM1711861.1 hypothetical protein [Pseudomonas sp. 165]ORL53159.1 hypothetical protein B7H18_04020 [Pseudomonas putida]
MTTRILGIRTSQLKATYKQIVLRAALSAALACFASTVTAEEQTDMAIHTPEPTAIDYQACDGLAEGDLVEYSMAGGKSFIGTCEVIEGRLAAVPLKGTRSAK